MKYKLHIALWLLPVFVGSYPCERMAMNEKEIIVTKHENLEQYVTQIITVRGLVTNTKIPTIIGVDVASDNPDLRGQYAEATGKLIKLIIREEEIDKYSTNRGAGIFYRLQDLNHPEYDAPVRPVREEQE